MTEPLWWMNNDGTITVPHALKMRDTPIFIQAGISHNESIIERSNHPPNGGI